MLPRGTTVIVVLALALGLSSTAGAAQKPKKSAAFDAAKVFKMLDANNDGKLSPDEFKNVTTHAPAKKGKAVKAPAADTATVFKKLDTNNDGALSPDEFKSVLSTLATPKKKKTAK
jgi:Ca2+-binding EF-hand superfamily protein